MGSVVVAQLAAALTLCAASELVQTLASFLVWG